MSLAFKRFREMCKHQCPYGEREVFTNTRKQRIDVLCSCGQQWHWGLWGELKKRQPEGYVEWLFEDEKARARLRSFVNGILVIRDESPDYEWNSELQGGVCSMRRWMLRVANVLS